MYASGSIMYRLATYDTVLHTNSLSRNVLTWLGSIAGVQAAGGYVAAQLGAFVAGPLGFFLGGITGYTLEYIISSATCPGELDTRDEL